MLRVEATLRAETLADMLCLLVPALVLLVRVVSRKEGEEGRQFV
jgi:hypothetical protein